MDCAIFEIDGSNLVDAKKNTPVITKISEISWAQR